MGKHKFYEAIWELKCFDKNGNLRWQEEGRNALVDQGEMLMLDVFFRNASITNTFYARLARDILEDTDTLTTIQNEPVGNGYSPQPLARSSGGFPILEKHEGDYRVVSSEVSFTASGGDIGPINLLFLATTSDNTGYLIGYMPLSVERLILDGDTMTAKVRVKLK